ncbi:serologically defined colon cancer antigen 8 homolog isoform X2 [Corticium candelabrum]|uniref:serologically defined colon cancer antigen 8 homolog isoform X2 n=1 Tax=Corticium candelabrum TaxID=121492 RepID=UPI002E260615|nr:serologically defined colon cancer antigen 8 homolog isoform X2 [Corticium candelabrum]
MAATTLGQSVKVSRRRVAGGREGSYGAVQRLCSMLEQLHGRASRSVELKQQEASGSGSPAVRSVLGRLSRCRSGFASADEMASALEKQRRFVNQLREETISYETHLERRTGSRVQVDTNGDEEQAKGLPAANSLDKSLSYRAKVDSKKEDMEDKSGEVMPSQFLSPPHLHTQVVTAQENGGQKTQGHYGEDNSRATWPEARAIVQLQREKNDALELCKALQETLAQFHRQEREVQIRMRQALDCIQKADEFKAEAEKSQRELLEQMEQIEVVHQEQLSSMEESYEKKLQGISHERQSQIDYLNQKLSETTEEVEGLKRQLEKSRREVEQEKDKATRSEEKRKHDYKRLQDEISRTEAKHTREMELKDDRLDEATDTNRLQSKQQQTLEEQLEVLQLRLQTYERDCVSAQDKSCSLQERVSSLQKELAEYERQNAVLLEKLNAAGEEKKDLERSVCHLQLLVHKTRVQAEGSFGDLGSMVEEQKQLAARWKRESELLADRLQETTARLQQQRKLEQTAVQEEIESLEKKLVDSQLQCVRHGAVHQEMQQLLRETDQRAITSQKQVLVLLERQKNLLEERQSLCGKLEQLQQHVIELKAKQGSPT